VRAGKLRHSVIIQTATLAKDSFAGSTETWSTFATVNASIEQIKGYDKAAIAATLPGADYTISIRYLTGVTANMRIKHGDTIYTILGQPNDIDGRNREIILTCQRGIQGG
jgi:SPP1 family predicted phage head-tail adaptor